MAAGTALLAPAAIAAPPVGSPAPGSAPTMARPAVAANAPRPLGCLIGPDRVAEVGSQVIGLVEHLAVDRGDSVVAGQPLLTLQATVERANASAAETRARVDADVLAARANLDLADQKLRRAEMLSAQAFVSPQAVEQARGEAELARHKLNQAQSQKRIWGEERSVAQAQLALRTVRSPFAGVVVERYVNAGERVEERPLMRVAVINPLRVELMVPTAHYGAIARGDRIAIRPELPGAEPVNATVTQVDQVLDAASNSFRVRLTLPNPKNRLPAGLRCKADLPFAAEAHAAVAPAARATVARAAQPAQPSRRAPSGGPL